jgi:ricin-type beta-trefoil lectin protein
VSPRRQKRPSTRIFIGLTVALAAVGSAAAVPTAVEMIQTAYEPPPITSVPADNPDVGIVYAGLTPAKKRTPCVGAYQVNDRNQCTHGPDPVPAGLEVKKDVAPIAPARPADAVPDKDPSVGPAVAGPSEADVTGDENGFTTDQGLAVVPDASSDTAQAAVGASGVVCEGDGTSGKRIQVLYVRDASTKTRYAERLESFRTMAAGVDTIYDASAKETGGSRHIRYVTRPDCTVDLPEVVLPDGSMADFGKMINALRALGHNRTDRKYMIFGDAKVYCGIGSYAGDTKTGSNNRNNSGPSYGRSDSGCWSASVAAHELTHNLGAVADSAPNSSKKGHCTDDYDIMCYNDGGLSVKVVCADRAHEQRLDCNHNDYFNTNPEPGNYLAKNWNVASNAFLISGQVGPGPTPTPTPTPTKPPTPSPSTSPSPSVSPSKPPVSPSESPSKPGSPSPSGSTPAPPTGQKKLRVTETRTTSTRLSWDAAAPGTRYAVISNGKTLGLVRSTSVRIVGMKPDTEYRLSVSLSAANGTLTAYTETVTVKTPAAPTPQTGKSVVFANALSSRVANLYGGNTAAGTPLVLDDARGTANQQWVLDPAAGGTVLIKSKATGLCVAPKNNADTAGSPLVQVACDTASAAQRWRLATTPYGTALTSAAGLVVGVGGCRFADNRMLVLQRPTGAKYQSWGVSVA